MVPVHCVPDPERPVPGDGSVVGQKVAQADQSWRMGDAHGKRGRGFFFFQAQKTAGLGTVWLAPSCCHVEAQCGQFLFLAGVTLSEEPPV